MPEAGIGFREKTRGAAKSGFMETILYAEVYLICIIVVGLVLAWNLNGWDRSSQSIWFRVILYTFLLNFLANFFFKLFSGGILPDTPDYRFSWLLKTLYHLTLCVGVFAWCGYADTERGSGVFQDWRTLRYLYVLLVIPLVMIVLNLRTQWIFTVEEGRYDRNWMFQIEMAYLSLCSLVSSVRLLIRSRRESDPNVRSQMWLTSSFSVCILGAWAISSMGEAFPVICVCIMVEILVQYVTASRNQISLDKLTQVNNRQNLIGFMDYKQINHTKDLFLMMIDLDDFKQINDRYGHLEGDLALVKTAQILKNSCGSFQLRPYIARYGGDEFIIILEDEAGGVAILKERIFEGVRSFNEDSSTWKLKLSIGTVRWEPGMTHKKWIALADKEMYRIKKEKKISSANFSA